MPTSKPKSAADVGYRPTDSPLELMERGLKARQYKQDVIEDLRFLARTAEPTEKLAFQDGIRFIKRQIRLCEAPT